MSNNEQIDRTDLGRRNVVFTKKPATVLIKVASKQKLGVRRVERDDVAIQAKHQALANKINVNQYAFANPGKRVVPDSGAKVLGPEFGVNMGELVTELKAKGYKFTDAHSFTRDRGDPMNVFSFCLEGDEKPIPAELEKFLKNTVVNSVHVWANRTEDGGRLDTINTVDSGQTGHFSKKLMMDGNTYRVVSAR